MIKALIFDFDNTLCELAEAHYQVLNEAIAKVAGPEYLIARKEQDTKYNGLSTSTKINMLIKEKNLPEKFGPKIRELKQQFTLDYIKNNITENNNLILNLANLRSEGYRLCCASNALHETVRTGLECLGIFDLFDVVIGNDHIKRQKPCPDIYLQSFIEMESDPQECLIIEDSKHGRESAVRSGAHICTVDNPNDLTYDHMKKSIDKANKKEQKIRWTDSKLNVLIPMAGLGSRFADAGFKLPKPLIDVNGKPMIKMVIDNLNIDANYIFIVQKDHYEKYNLEILLKAIAPGCKIVQANGMNGGAACHSLLAKDLINNDDHLLIANSDQYVEWDSCDFLSQMLTSGADGGIVTFKATGKKWSYAKCEEDGTITKVAEKDPISEDGTAGIYWFKHGSEYVRSAEQMIKKDIKTNNEHYICPSYNEAIENGLIIKNFPCKKMAGVGTPEDLEAYLKNL
jgi:HAD superfamily hydrolase (TIGR01509 family)